jgi:hypothetical protein
VFDSFPWPQAPSGFDVKAVADSAVELRKIRAALKAKHSLSLRELYRSLDLPGEHSLKNAQVKLDAAVRAAYDMPVDMDPLVFLLSLNDSLAQQESDGICIGGPGLPPWVTDRASLVTVDAVQAEPIRREPLRP